MGKKNSIKNMTGIDEQVGLVPKELLLIRDCGDRCSDEVIWVYIVF